jgi:hypothetical protein
VTGQWVRSPGAVSALVDGETVLMSSSDDRCYALIGPAERVWQLLEQPRAAGDVASALVAEFTVDPERCRVEVDDLLAQMSAAGLVTAQG